MRRIRATHGSLPAMEPRLVTLAKDRPVLDELRRREPIFHRTELARTRADFEAMNSLVGYLTEN